MFEDLFSKTGLSLDRLRTLVELQESGSLILAAKGDIGRQGRLSHHIRELSSFFGVALTVRSGRTIKLTEAGENLVRIAKEQFQVLRTFKDQSLGETSVVTIGAGDSLAQWLVVPAIGQLRRGRKPVNLCLKNLRTQEIRPALMERTIEFALLRLDGVEKPIKQAHICNQKYGVFMPKRLIPSRGLLTFKDALLAHPHAALGGDGKLIEQLKTLGRELGGSYKPELSCASINQCVAAVQTGAFASVLPTHAWPQSPGLEYAVFGEAELEHLTRKIVLAWLPRTMDVVGMPLERLRQELINSLKQQASSHGAC